MKTKKLNIKKLNITKLTSAEMIKGGTGTCYYVASINLTDCHDENTNFLMSQEQSEVVCTSPDNTFYNCQDHQH